MNGSRADRPEAHRRMPLRRSQGSVRDVPVRLRGHTAALPPHAVVSPVRDAPLYLFVLATSGPPFHPHNTKISHFPETWELSSQEMGKSGELAFLGIQRYPQMSFTCPLCPLQWYQRRDEVRGFTNKTLKPSQKLLARRLDRSHVVLFASNTTEVCLSNVRFKCRTHKSEHHRDALLVISRPQQPLSNAFSASSSTPPQQQ